MEVGASDQSKISARAGGVSVSRGSSIGVGASVVTVVSNNEVKANIADGTSLKAKNLKVKAERRRIDFSDFTSPVKADLFLTDSSKLSDKEREDADTGIIDIHKDKDDSGYKVEVNLTSEQLLETVDLLNFLSFTNYYVESIAGSIMGNEGSEDSNASVAGSVAVLYFRNKIDALIGKNVKIDLTGSDDASDDSEGDGMTLEAIDETNVRAIAGALSVAPSTAGVGVTMAYLQNKDTVNAKVGDGTVINTNGTYRQKAATDQDIQLFTAAASISTGSKAKYTVGGAVNVIAADNEAEAEVGKNARITAGKGLSVDSKTDMDLLLVSVSAAGSGSAQSAAAVGGTIDVIVNQAKTKTTIGEGAVLTSTQGDVELNADAKAQLISAIASASAAPSGGKAAAGSLGVLVDLSDTEVNNKAKSVSADNGSVNILANGDSVIGNGSLAVAGAGKGGAGGAVINVNVFDRDVTAKTAAGSVINAGENITSQANGKDVTVLVGVAAAGSGDGLALTGTIPVIVALNNITNEIGENAKLTAGGTIAANAHLSTRLYDVAGGVSVASGGSAIGAVISTAILKNEVTNTIGKGARLMADAALPEDDANGSTSGASQEVTDETDKTKKGVELRNGKVVRGVYVGADSSETVILGSLGVAGSTSSTALQGVVNTLVISNKVKAIANEAVMTAGYGTDPDKALDALVKGIHEGNVIVDAYDETYLFNISGALSASLGSAGVGVTAPVIVFSKEVAAEAEDAVLLATGETAVNSETKDDVWELAVTASGASGNAVAAGADVLVFNNSTQTKAGGKLTSQKDASVKAKSNAKLHTIGAVAAGAGGNAISPVAVVTYFNGKTLANVQAGSQITSTDGDVIIDAKSLEDLLTVSAGVAVGGGAAVSGAVNVYVTKLETQAATGAGAKLTGRNITVNAYDDYAYFGTSAILAGGGAAAVGVNAIVNIAKNTVGANVGEDNVLNATDGSVFVTADAKRDVASYAASVAGGGTAGVGATIMVDVIGGKLQQDAADALIGKKDGNEDQKGSFDPNGFKGLLANNHKEANDGLGSLTLSEDLEGDGSQDSSIRVEEGIEVQNGYQEDETTTASGENEKLDNTANIGKTNRTETPKDAVTASVGKNSAVTAKENITVQSHDQLTVDSISGTIAAGGVAGVGVGISVFVDYSNVEALVASGAFLKAGGDVKVDASSASYERDLENASEEAKSKAADAAKLVEESGSGDDVSDNGIRVIAVTGSVGGVAGVAVPVAILSLETNVNAIVAGDIQAGGNVAVSSLTGYDKVTAATLAVAGGGAAGVATPVAVVRSSGNAESSVQGNSVTAGGDFSVTGNHTLKGQSIAIPLSVGTVSVNAAVPVTINRLNAKTYIADGVEVDAGSVRVHTDTDTEARATSVGISGGVVAVGMGVAVVIDEPTVSTYIGAYDPETIKDDNTSTATTNTASVKTSKKDVEVKAADGTVTTRKTSGNVEVSHNVKSKATPAMANVTAGGVAVSGNVLLAFNRTKAVSGIIRTAVDAEGDLDVSGRVERAEATSKFANVTVGGVAVGASESYAQLRMINDAIVDTTNVTVKANNVTVSAGKKDAPSVAVADVTALSANAGLVSVSANAAVADNDVTNRARVIGSGKLLASGDVTTQAYLKAESSADLVGVSEGLVGAIDSVVIGLNRASNEANLGAEEVTGRNIIVEANLNGAPVAAEDGVDASDNAEKLASTWIRTGSGGVYAKTMNTGIAIARADNKSTFSAKKTTASGDLSVKATGNAASKSDIGSVTMGLAAGGLIVNYSKTEGTFDAKMILPDEARVQAKSVSVLTDYMVKSDSMLSPSAGGVDVSGFSMKDNKAYANTATKAEASITGKGNAVINAQNDVEVLANGNVIANSEIEGAYFSGSIVGITNSNAFSSVTAGQKAYVDGVGKGKVQEQGIHSENGNVKVASDQKVKSLSVVEADIVNISGWDAKITTALADSDATNLAYVNDSAVIAQEGKVTVEADQDVDVTPEAKTGLASLSWVSLGATVVNSDANNTVKSYIDGDSLVSAKQVDVLANGDATVTVKGGRPAFSASYQGFGLVILDANAGDQTTWAYIGKDAAVYANGIVEDLEGNTNDVHGLNVKADSEVKLEAIMPEFASLSAFSFGAYFVSTTVGSTDTRAYINGTAFSADDINVEALDHVDETSRVTILNASLGDTDLSKIDNKVGSSKEKSQHTYTGFGAGANVTAWGNIQALAKSRTDVYGQMSGSNLSLAELPTKKMQVSETIFRTTEAEVGDGATVQSMIGNLTIEALEDKEGSVAGNTVGDAISILDFPGDPSTDITNTSVVSTVIGNGVTLEAKYGDLNVLAVAGHQLDATTTREATVGIGSNTSKSSVTDETTVTVTVAKMPALADGEKAPAQTRILGENTTIAAYIDGQNDHSYALSYTKAAGSRTEADASLTVKNTVHTLVDNAWVGGIESLNIEALVQNQRVIAESFAEIKGATGKVIANSTVDGFNDVLVEVTKNAVTAGKDITVKADAPDITSETISSVADAVANTIVQWVVEKVKYVTQKLVKKTSKIPIIGWIVKWVTKTITKIVDELVMHVLYSDASSSPVNKFKNTGTVIFNGTAIVGGGAAGIYMDVYGGDMDAIHVAGLDSDLVDANGNPTNIEVIGNQVIVNGIFNDDEGTLDLISGKGDIIGKDAVVISTNQLPEITIVNHTEDYDLVLKDLVFTNVKESAPAVNTRASGSDKEFSFSYSTKEIESKLNVKADHKTNVIFRIGNEKSVDIGEGVFTAQLNEGTISTEGDMFIAANKVWITGAGQVGTSITQPFNLKLFDIAKYPGIEGIVEGYDAKTNALTVEASGAVYLSLTPVKEWTYEGQEEEEGENASETALHLDRVHGGDDSMVYININAPEKTYANKLTSADSVEDYFITEPRGNMEFVHVTADAEGTVLTRVRLKDADGNDTDYYLSDTGLLMNVKDAILINAGSYLIEQDDKYDTYRLPGGQIVVVEVDRVNNTSRLVRVLGEGADPDEDEDGREDYGSEVFEFSNLEIVEKDGVVTIHIKEKVNADGTLSGKTVTFDENGNARIAIDVNGGTTFIMANEALDGWMLPNGVRIFYSQAFVDLGNKEAITGVVIRRSGNTEWLLLEKPEETGSTIRYHVVQRTFDSATNTYEFVEGQLFDYDADTTVKQTTSTRGQYDYEAEEALKAALESVKDQLIAKLTAAVTESDIADILTPAVQSKLTADHSVSFTVSSRNVGTNNNPSYRYTLDILLDDAAASIVSYNSAATGTAAITTINGTAISGTMADLEETAYAATYDGRTLWIKQVNGTWTGYLQNKTGRGSRKVTLTGDPESGWYTVAANDRTDAQALSGKWYVRLGDVEGAYGSLNLYGEGESNKADEKLNGGYYFYEGAGFYHFVQSTTGSILTGIILSPNRTLALFPDGSYGYVSREGLSEEDAGGNENLMEETVAVSPEMTVKENGTIDTAIQKAVTDANGRQQYIVTDKYGTYVETLYLDDKELTNYKDTDVDHGRGGYIYTPQYELMKNLIVVKPTADESKVSGAYIYFLAGDKVDPFEVSRDARGYGILDRYTRIIDSYQKDGKGVALAAAEELGLTEALPQGTILYLNSDGEIVAYLTPDGTFRQYETVTETDADGNETSRVKTLADVTGDSQAADASEKVYTTFRIVDGKLQAQLSKGSATHAMELSSDIYASAYGLQDEEGNWTYDKAAYFGYNSEGNLILLDSSTKTWYVYEDGRLNPADEAEAVESGIRINIDGERRLEIINDTKREDYAGRTVYILTDDTTVDSDGRYSELNTRAGRVYEPVTDDMVIDLGEYDISGGEVVVQGTSTDDAAVVIVGGDDALINTDTLVIVGNEGVSFGTEDDHMNIAPLREDAATHVVFYEKSEVVDGKETFTGSYGGSAYVDFEGSAVFQNSSLAGNAHVEAAVAGETAGISHLILTDDALLAITAPQADVTITDLVMEDGAAVSVVTGKGSVTATTAIILPDQTSLSLTGTDGDMSFVSIDVEDGNKNGLSIKTSDSDLSDGRSGNVTIQDHLYAGGRTVLDLSGSFTGTQAESTLELGKDTYADGTSFTFGGDLGSKEIPMVVDLIAEDGSTIPLNIVSVRDVYIVDAEKLDTAKDEEIITTDAADPAKIAEAAAEAVSKNRAVIASEDATAEEKAQAQAAIDQISSDLEKILTGEALEKFRNDPESISKDELSEMIRQAVEDAFGNAAQDAVPAQAAIDLYGKVLTEEERQALIEELKKEADARTPVSVGDLDAPKEMEVNIGSVTGTEGINISSNGDVTLTVDKADNEGNTVRIGTIETSRSDLTPDAKGVGDVTVTVKDGSIAGNDNAGDANITAQNITLNAETGSIDSMKVNQTEQGTKTSVDLTNLKDEDLAADNITFEVVDGKLVAAAKATYTEEYASDENAAGSVSANADGNIDIAEVSGDMGAGVINSKNGTVTLATGEKTAEDGTKTLGDLLDARTDEQKAAGQANITAGAQTGTSTITAGGVGVSPDAENGQEQQPIVVDIASSDQGLVVDAQTDINLDAKNSLTAVTDSKDGKVYADAEKDLTISTTEKSGNGTGDLTIVDPTVGGSLTINSAGKVNAQNEDGTVGDLAAPENVTVNAKDDITAANVTAQNGDATVKSENGDITTATVSAGDTATISAANGNIIEGERPEGTPAVKGDNVVLETAGKLGSSDAPYEVDTASGNTGSGTLTVTAGEAFIKEQTGDVDIDTVTTTKNDTGDGKTTSGDFNLATDGNVTGGSVTSEGNTDINAGGSVGTERNPLTVNADGTVKVDADGDTVNLKSDQDMKIDSISSNDGSGDVKIDADGSITDTNGAGGNGSTPAIAAGNVDLTSGGSVGTDNNPLDLSADNAKINAKGSVNVTNDKDLRAEDITSETGDVNLDVDGDLTIDNIDAKDEVNIKANGDVTGTDKADPNIKADSLNIDTTGAGDEPGNVSGKGGENGNALTTDVNNLSGNTGDLTLDNDNGADGTLTVDSLTGKDVDITTSGTLRGSDTSDPNITADNLKTKSGGNTENLKTKVSGELDQTSVNGTINGKNSGADYTNDTAADIAKKNAEASVSKEQILLARAKAKKKKVTLLWTSVKGATDYVIYWNGKVYKKVSASVRKLVLKGLKKKKVNNFKVVAVRNGKTITSSLLSYTGIKLKKALPKKVKSKSKLTLKVKKSKKLKYKIKKKGKGKLLKKGRRIRYLMDKKGIIKVSKSGKITGLKKGTVKLYSIAVNGMWKTTKITVK